jgi:type 1 fimbria pilin
MSNKLRVALAGFAAFALVVAACSDDDDNNEVTVEFTGDDCVYSGPTEFEVGDEIEITVSDVTDERVDIGYAVNKVPDGTSVETASEEGFIESLSDLSDTYLNSEVTEEGTERVLSATLDVAGTWLVHCFVFNHPQENVDIFPATTFEVVEES